MPSALGVARRLACAVGAASVLTAGCGAATTPAAHHAAGVAAVYLGIARAGNHRLEVDVDALKGKDRDRLGAAGRDLRDAAATERLFDRRLLALRLPASLAGTAADLVRANRSRAALSDAAAASASLRQLRAYERKLDAANASVERKVRLLRRGLGLPPPDTN